jgi:HEAT repeats
VTRALYDGWAENDVSKGVLLARLPFDYTFRGFESYAPHHRMGLHGTRVAFIIARGGRMILTRAGVLRAERRSDILELLAAAEDGLTESVRLAAISALKSLKDASAVPALMRICASHPPGTVREAAETALVELGADPLDIKISLLKQAILDGARYFGPRYPERQLQQALVRLSEILTKDRLGPCIDLLIRLFKTGRAESGWDESHRLFNPLEMLSKLGAEASRPLRAVAALTSEQFAATLDLANKLWAQKMDPGVVLLYGVPALAGIRSEDFAAALSFIDALAGVGIKPYRPLSLALRIKETQCLTGPSFKLLLGCILDFEMLRPGSTAGLRLYDIEALETLPIDGIREALPLVARGVELLQMDQRLLSRIVDAIHRCSESTEDFRVNLQSGVEFIERLRQHDNVPPAVNVEQLALEVVGIKKNHQDYEIVIRPATWHEEEYDFTQQSDPPGPRFIIRETVFDDPGSVTLQPVG